MFEIYTQKIKNKIKILLEHIVMSTYIKGSCCNDDKFCFILSVEDNFMISNNKNTKKKIDDNNLCFVMALQSFRGGPTKAKQLCNFLGVPHFKNFIQKKLHDSKLFFDKREKTSMINQFMTILTKNPQHSVSKMIVFTSTVN